MRRLTLPLVLAAAAASSPARGDDVVVFEGMCDASGAVPLDDRRFVVADDEDNVLRIYDADRGGPPQRSVDISAGLGLPAKKKQPELDLEGATRLGDLALWITSHGRNSKSKLKPERLRFFATTAPSDGVPSLVGTPCTTLLAQLLASPAARGLGLAAAAERGPKEPGGLNIEGMTATGDGRIVLGFRNPIPQGKAIMLPVENPREIVSGQPARFGAPIRLDLGGLGVRALSRWRGRFLIAAGPIADGPTRRLYGWSGRTNPNEAPVALKDFADFNPEGFFTPETRERAMVLSDDGSRLIDGKECKRLTDPRHKRFRGTWLRLPP